MCEFVCRDYIATAGRCRVCVCVCLCKVVCALKCNVFVGTCADVAMLALINIRSTTHVCMYSFAPFAELVEPHIPPHTEYA